MGGAVTCGNVVVAAVAAAVLTATTAACGADDADGASSGGAVYDANCALCHGADLRGTERGPSLLSIVYEPAHHPDESIRSAIANGVSPHHWDFGPMPIIGGLSAAEVDAVIAHVRSVQVAQGFEPYPPR